jgi:hypothetical protein
MPLEDQIMSTVHRELEKIVKDWKYIEKSDGLLMEHSTYYPGTQEWSDWSDTKIYFVEVNPKCTHIWDENCLYSISFSNDFGVVRNRNDGLTISAHYDIFRIKHSDKKKLLYLYKAIRIAGKIHGFYYERFIDFQEYHAGSKKTEELSEYLRSINRGNLPYTHTFSR